MRKGFMISTLLMIIFGLLIGGVIAYNLILMFESQIIYSGCEADYTTVMKFRNKMDGLCRKVDSKQKRYPEGGIRIKGTYSFSPQLKDIYFSKDEKRAYLTVECGKSEPENVTLNYCDDGKITPGVNLEDYEKLGEADSKIFIFKMYATYEGEGDEEKGGNRIINVKAEIPEKKDKEKD